MSHLSFIALADIQFDFPSIIGDIGNGYISRDGQYYCHHSRFNSCELHDDIKFIQRVDFQPFMRVLNRDTVMRMLSNTYCEEDVNDIGICNFELTEFTEHQLRSVDWLIPRIVDYIMAFTGEIHSRELCERAFLIMCYIERMSGYGSACSFDNISYNLLPQVVL